MNEPFDVVVIGSGFGGDANSGSMPFINRPGKSTRCRSEAS